MTLCADSYPWNKLKVDRGIGGFRKEMPYRTSTDRGDWITICTNVLNTLMDLEEEIKLDVGWIKTQMDGF